MGHDDLGTDNPEAQRILDDIGRRMLKRRVDALKNLPTFPESILRINHVIVSDAEEASFERVAPVIETDPVLTARILRLVNSAFYGLSGGVSTVYEALVMLGLDIVRGLILSTNTMEMVAGRRGIRGLWEHSFGTAVAVIALGRTLALPRLRELSAAALMHDIGKMVLASQLGQEYDQVVAHAVARRVHIRAAEERLLGVPHDEIGRWLVTRWRLPASLAVPIARHHTPQDAGEHGVAASAVHVADIMIRGYGFGFAGDDMMPSIHPFAWKTLGLNQAKIQRAVAEMHLDLQRALVQANLYAD